MASHTVRSQSHAQVVFLIAPSMTVSPSWLQASARPPEIAAVPISAVTRSTMARAVGSTPYAWRPFTSWNN